MRNLIIKNLIIKNYRILKRIFLINITLLVFLAIFFIIFLNFGFYLTLKDLISKFLKDEYLSAQEINVNYNLYFYGAVSGIVDGSCYLLSNKNESVIVDIGSFFSNEQEKNLNNNLDNNLDINKKFSNENIDFKDDLKKLKAIIITHAHDDHIGRLHYLVYELYKRNVQDYKIYMTLPTYYIYIQKIKDTIKYSKIPKELKKIIEKEIINKINIISPNSYFYIGNNIEGYTILNSHIPGSVSILLNIKNTNKKILFSGDIGNDFIFHLNPLQYEELNKINPDYLIIESTYGDKNFSYNNEKEYNKKLQEFLEYINYLKRQKKKVIIPAFAVDRTQKVLFTLLYGVENNIIDNDIKIAIGGKSSQKITQAYLEMINNPLYDIFFNKQKINFNITYKNKIWYFDRFKESELDRLDEKISKYDVIISPSASGESSDSKVLLNRFLYDSKVVVIKVSWTPPNSLVSKIFKNNYNSYNRNYSELFSSHADKKSLIKYIKNLKHDNLKTIIITHGSNLARDSLEIEIKNNFKNISILKPNYADKITIK
ncbi:MAG: MBL fold metallo-hydrolase [bacterium]